MVILSETLALTAYPGKVVLSDYKTVHGLVQVNQETPIKIFSDTFKVWLNTFKQFVLSNVFNLISIESNNENYQISKNENNLWICFRNCSYILSKNDVILILFHFPKMYIVSLCLPPEIFLIFNSLFQEFEKKLLNHYSEFNNFNYDINAVVETDFLKLIKEIITLYELNVSPFFVYSILYPYKKKIKYLVQATTIEKFIEFRQQTIGFELPQNVLEIENQEVPM